MARTGKTRKGPKTYFPSKVFDDHMEGLSKMCKEKGWSFSGTDVKQLEKDVLAQRVDRAAFDKLERQFLAARQTFGITQQGRYERFAAVLRAARGAFKRDRSVMAELARFKRPAKARAPKAQKPFKVAA
jgi:hypothetical protein